MFIHKNIQKFYQGEKKIIKEGKNKQIIGKSIGTNLGSMMYLVGTQYFPDMTDKILFIESLHSSPFFCKS